MSKIIEKNHYEKILHFTIIRIVICIVSRILQNTGTTGIPVPISTREIGVEKIMKSRTDYLSFLDSEASS